MQAVGTRGKVGGLYVLVVGLALGWSAERVDAGCGCDKPPPPPAVVRPAFASPGGAITLFSSELRSGEDYLVRFGNARTVNATALVRRDLADGVAKAQLVVVVPDMPMGPSAITVERRGKKVLSLDESEFTVLQASLPLAEEDSATLVRCYSAAVANDGTVYIPLDVGAIRQRTVFSGVGEGFPLLFSAADVVIYNTQGFVMQLLAGQSGLYEIRDLGAPDSFELTYDRHEFVTYQDAHVHEGLLALDPADPAWHVDGTRHVDHDHLVIAIAGALEDGGKPAAGSTQPFDLSIVTVLADAGDDPVSRVVQWSSVCTREAAEGTANR